MGSKNKIHVFMEKLRNGLLFLSQERTFLFGFTSILDFTGSTFKDKINACNNESIYSSLKNDFTNVAGDINRSFLKETEKIDAK